MYAAAAAGLARRVLRRLRRLHIRAGGLLRVLQPAASLDTVHHHQHRRPAGQLAPDDPCQREHLPAVHRLPGGPDGVDDARAWNDLPHDGGRLADGVR